MRAPPLAPSVPTEGETDNKSEPQNPERGQYVVGLSGTGKTHLAVSIARACIRNGRRGRFFNVVDLVNKLDAEARAERQGRTADLISRLDFLILDELG
jgi:DNA replication protein DnaC